MTDETAEQPEARQSAAKRAVEIARKELRKIGRPTDYTEELATSICSLLSTRTETGRVRSMRDVCGMLDLQEGVVYSWLTKEPAFAEMYDRAREVRADMLADDLGRTAEDATPEGVHKAKLVIETNKWSAAKLNPRRYADRNVLAGDPNNPLAVTGVDSILQHIAGATRGLPSDKG